MQWHTKRDVEVGEDGKEEDQMIGVDEENKVEKKENWEDKRIWSMVKSF